MANQSLHHGVVKQLQKIERLKLTSNQAREYPVKSWDSILFLKTKDVLLYAVDSVGPNNRDLVSNYHLAKTGMSLNHSPGLWSNPLGDPYEHCKLHHKQMYRKSFSKL